MAWVPDVYNCTEKPEPTSSVSGPGSYSARLATRNHDMWGAERLHRKQNVLRRHHGPGVGILGLDHHVGYRYPPLWIGEPMCLVSHHGHLTGHARKRTNTDGVPALQASPWMVSNDSLIGSTVCLPIDGAVRAVLLHLD